MTECELLAEHLATALDGRLPPRLQDHIDACDACCDLLQDATALGDAIRGAGNHYRHALDFEARINDALDPDGVEPTRPMRRVSGFR
jgi:hypothetical protein